MLNKPVEELNIINSPPGNGGSVSAIRKFGKCGYLYGSDPPEGLVMGVTYH